MKRNGALSGAVCTLEFLEKRGTRCGTRWTCIVAPSNINNWPCPSPGFRPSLGSPDIFMDRGTRLPPSHACLALSIPCLPRGFFFLKTSASLNINATLSLHIPLPPLSLTHPLQLRIRTARQNPWRFQTSLPLPSRAESRFIIYYLRVG